MYPTGWKHTPLVNNASGLPSDVTTSYQITEFATGLQAPEEFIIPCEGFQYCLFAFAGESSLGGYFDAEVWGTQTSGEAAQQIDFCLNFRLCTLKPNANSSVSNVDFPSLGLTGWQLWQITSNDQDSGANTDVSSAAIGALHFWNRIAGNQTIAGYQDPTTEARSGDSSDSTKLWEYIGSVADSGAAWFAVPCGPFNYLQIEVSDIDGGGDENPGVILYNLLT